MEAPTELHFERVVPLPAQAIWDCWTRPQRLMPWFCPKPWHVVECEIDLRPGGIFRTLMQGPDGQQHDGVGCWLELAAPHRLAWTSLLGPGFRPLPAPAMAMTAILEFTPQGPDSTRYSARILHRTAEECAQHAAMGFEQGWGMALDQLVAMVRSGA